MSIVNEIRRGANILMLQTRKYAPELLTAGAMVSGAAAIGFTIKQTRTAEHIFGEVGEFHRLVADTFRMQEELTEEQVQRFKEKNGKELYTQERYKRDTVIFYYQTGVKLLKHYAVPISLAAVSGLCMLASYKVSKARYAAAVAAYTGLQGAFDDYKKQVAEKFGDDTNKELVAETLSKQMQEVKDEQTGNVTKQVRPNCSQYARFFDESSIYFKREAGDNLSFLQRQQAFANQLLRMNGCVFLNEVYDMLGFPRTKAGSIVGWIWNPTEGEQQIDFGFWNLDDQKKRDFINGWERSVLLDFNVDGVIFDMI